MQADCTIELARNWHSVPWRLLGETVRIVQQGAQLTIHHMDTNVATHAVAPGLRVQRVDPAHLAGVSMHSRTRCAARPWTKAPRTAATPSLLRPLSEYAAVIGEEVAETA